MEVAGNPIQHFLMFIAGWIADSFQGIVVPWDTTAVFGRTLKFAAHADRIGNPRSGWQHFLNGDRMLPTVAKVVGIHGLRTNFAENREQMHGAFIADGG